MTRKSFRTPGPPFSQVWGGAGHETRLNYELDLESILDWNADLQNNLVFQVYSLVPKVRLA